MRLGFFRLWAIACIAAACSSSSTEIDAQDCNGNSVADAVELAEGAEDCNENGQLDVCEVGSVLFGSRPGLPVSSAPSEVEIADFDGDGRLDGLGVLATDDGVSVALFINVAPREFERFELPLEGSGRLENAISDDFDGDGRHDLLLHESGSVAVYLKTDDGFTEQLRVPSSPGLSGLAVGDLDGDGQKELIVTERTQDAVLVYPNLGDALGDAQQYPTGDSARAPTVADFNGDGHFDVATANRRSDNVSILFGAGDLTLNLQENALGLGGNEQPDGLLAADFDDDGSLDLAAKTRTAIVMLLNQGDGTFVEPQPFAIPGPRTTRETFAVVDAEGDGDMDILTAREEPVGIIFLLNQGEGQFDASVSVERRNMPVSAAVGDLDDDGRADLLSVLLFSNDLDLLWGGEENTLELASSVDLPVTGDPHSITIVDMDGDGDLDVPVGIDTILSIFRNDGSGNLTEDIVLERAQKLWSITHTDLDSDGDPDLVAAILGSFIVQLFFNDDGQFRLAQHRVGVQPNSIAAADFNGDDRPDLVTANTGSRDLTFLMNDGAEEFTRVDVETPGGPSNAIPVDIDRDGDIDLAVVVGDIVLLLNDGTASFPEQASYPTRGSRDAVVGDFDADGWPDVVGIDRGAVSLLRNLGDGTLAPADAFDTGLSHFSGAAVDVDSNGFLDVVTGNTTGAVFVYLNQGAARFDSPFGFRSGLETRFVAGGDLDGDGDNDLVAMSRTARQLHVFFNESGRSSTPFLTQVCTETDFYDVSISSSRGGSVERLTKFIVPADPQNPELLEPHFQNVALYPLHQEFLVGHFPDRFPTLTVERYDQLVNRRATRRYFVGEVFRLVGDDGVRYGFNLLADPGELPTLEEVHSVYETLVQVFSLTPFGYFPAGIALEEALAWGEPGFLVFVEDVPPEPPDPPDPGEVGPKPTFELEIPPGTEVCAAFLGRNNSGVGLSPSDWYQLKSQVTLEDGVIALPTDSDTFALELLTEVRFGPQRELATAAGPGSMRVREFPPDADGVTTYDFNYVQDFTLAGGATYELRLFNLRLRARGDKPLERLVFDDEFVTHRLQLEGFQTVAVGYSSCTYELLPLWEIRVELQDGSSLRFLERFEDPPDVALTGPGSLLHADVTLREKTLIVDDYWNLIYASQRHNTGIRYWTVFDEPVAIDGLDRPVRVVEVIHPQAKPFEIPAAVNYLDEGLQVLASPAVLSFERRFDVEEPELTFRRGDANGDGKSNLVDGLLVLDYLFARLDAPACVAAADANDDGRVNIIDAIAIVQLLFGGDVLPAPFPECGVDPTMDGLPCRAQEACAE